MRNVRGLVARLSLPGDMHIGSVPVFIGDATAQFDRALARADVFSAGHVAAAAGLVEFPRAACHLERGASEHEIRPYARRNKLTAIVGEDLVAGYSEDNQLAGAERKQRAVLGDAIIGDECHRAGKGAFATPDDHAAELGRTAQRRARNFRQRAVDFNWHHNGRISHRRAGNSEPKGAGSDAQGQFIHGASFGGGGNFRS